MTIANSRPLLEMKMSRNFKIMTAWLVLLFSTFSTSIATTPQLSTTTRSVGTNRHDKFQCDFENDFCDLTQDSKQDNFDWQRTKGRLPHAGTGPQVGDHTLSGEGHYIFINASEPRKSGDLARLITPTLRFSTRCAQLTFWYYALGYNLGSLAVRTGFSNGLHKYSNWSLVFRITGAETTKAWRKYQTTIITSTTFRLAFEGIVGNGFQGDYSIDDIDVKSVKCPHTIESTSTPKAGWALMYNTSTTGDKTKSEPVSVTSSPTRNQTTRPFPKNDEFPDWAVALLVIACVFIGAAVLFFIIRFIRKSRKGGSSQKYLAKNIPEQDNNHGNGTASSSMGTPPPGRIQRLSSDSAGSMEMSSKKSINVAVENNQKSFQTDYETEYGFGLKLGGRKDIPDTLMSVPKDFVKQAEKIDKQTEKQSRRNRSKMTVRQRRRLRIAAKMKAKMEAEQAGQADNSKKKPATFSVMHKDDKFGSEPGKKKPIPLPPPHILDMMAKMRSASNPIHAIEAGAGVDSNIAVVEPNSRIVRQMADHHVELEDISDDDYDHASDDLDENEAFDGSEDDDQDSEEDDEGSTVAVTSRIGGIKSRQGDQGLSPGNQVMVISHSSNPQVTSPPPSQAKSAAQSSTPKGLYDDLDDEDDENT